MTLLLASYLILTLFSSHFHDHPIYFIVFKCSLLHILARLEDAIPIFLNKIWRGALFTTNSLLFCWGITSSVYCMTVNDLIWGSNNTKKSYKAMQSAFIWRSEVSSLIRFIQTYIFNVSFLFLLLLFFLLWVKCECRNLSSVCVVTLVCLMNK